MSEQESKSLIRYTQPSIGDLEVAYATDAVKNGWGAHFNDYLVKFEEHARSFVGTQHAIATSSCTGAIHLGLAALGIGRGDEIIIADANWIASVAPVVHLGATPVFVDIDATTWCLVPEAVEKAITPRTKAVIAVHLYGNLCAIDRLSDLCRRHNIALIEDCAEAIGSQWRGEQVGRFGRFSVFSFHGTKTVTTGEGGLLATNDDALAERVRMLNNHGRAAGETKQFWASEVGYKYKMSNVQAAIGCAQLERVDELIAAKRKVFQVYADGLAHLPHITFNPEPQGTRNGYWMPTVVFDRKAGVTREQLMAAFKAQNIDARPFFYPLSSLPMFNACPQNTVSYDIPARAINLPSSPHMPEADQQRVIDVLENFSAK
ncbi:MAG: DegT/DnrJ/EryC1/StrS family aminotransferase [Rhodobacteraceae bacterium]|nr:DegT/DnrJ/EryC1/StrS family aminotransferase [Paracoccaceae bacterium]